MDALKPRIIRKVVKSSKKGRPKRVRDRRHNIDVERIDSAHSRHPCHRKSCLLEFVQTGETYIVVYYRERLRRMGKVMVPERKNFHVECVPNYIEPCLRFLL